MHIRLRYVIVIYIAAIFTYSTVVIPLPDLENIVFPIVFRTPKDTCVDLMTRLYAHIFFILAIYTGIVLVKSVYEFIHLTISPLSYQLGTLLQRTLEAA